MPRLLFEALPPPVEHDDAQWQEHLDALDGLRGHDLSLNVPEVLDGHYQTAEPRRFAARLHQHLGLQVSVNRITVHHSADALARWAGDTWTRYSIRDLVVVGGERHDAHYPGIGVTDALQTLAPGVRKRGGRLGVITIPTRRRAVLDEPERLRRKQQAGADFAVSQIIVESDAALALQHDVASTSTKKAAIPIYWSLAPVARRRDVEFLRWLGVEVAPAIEKRLLAPHSVAARLAESRDENLAIARRILEDAEEHGIVAGFCIEHVMQSNVAAAVRLVEDVAAVQREFQAVVVR